MMNRQAFIDEAHRLVREGNRLFGTDVVLDRVEFYDKGTSAGTACLSASGKYWIRLSEEAATLHYEDAFKHTLPHEIAHLIVYRLNRMHPVLGFFQIPGKRKAKQRYSAHGPKWRQVCLALGGNGKRCHSMGLTKARVEKAPRQKYRYTLPSGLTIELGATVHHRIQNTSRTYTARQSGERIAKEHYKALDD